MKPMIGATKMRKTKKSCNCRHHCGDHCNSKFFRGAVKINLSEASHMKRGCTPLCMFMLYFTEIIHLLVEESNRYHHQYLASLEDRPSPLPDVTDSEIFLFLGIIIQMDHDIRDRIRDYWVTSEKFLTPFYSNTLKHDKFLHILRFLHFTDNAEMTAKLTIMTD
jgi:hypothetical protein